jgi:hypothetical protein
MNPRKFLSLMVEIKEYDEIHFFGYIDFSCHYFADKNVMVETMALEISQATSKQSKATWRIYGKLMQS